jgi:SAM-dependent methyltransferase
MPEDHGAQYADDRNLAARQRLWAISPREPGFDLFGWVLGLADIDPGGTQRVLDVGCGNGAYERALAARGHRGPVVAVDLSAGMLAHVPGAASAQADVQQLPFLTDRFDVVLAPHMLYHVADIEAAAAECRRVLHPSGRFVAVTNGDANLAELRTLIEGAAGGGWRMERPSDRRFSMENGASRLQSAFASVTRVDAPAGEILVTDPDALAGYVASVRDLYEPQIAGSWADVVGSVRDSATAHIAAKGALRFTSSVGAFVCC